MSALEITSPSWGGRKIGSEAKDFSGGGRNVPKERPPTRNSLCEFRPPHEGEAIGGVKIAAKSATCNHFVPSTFHFSDRTPYLADGCTGTIARTSHPRPRGGDGARAAALAGVPPYPRRKFFGQFCCRSERPRPGQSQGRRGTTRQCQCSQTSARMARSHGAHGRVLPQRAPGHRARRGSGAGEAA